VSLRVSIADENDERAQSHVMKSAMRNIYNTVMDLINKIYQTTVDNIYTELLNEEEFNNII
jgi:hypothetical protein